MPTWGGILKELQPGFDTVRRNYLRKLHRYTKNNIILYASAFLQKPMTPTALIMITDEDIQGLMEVVHNLPERPTDLILHSPGGSSEAAEGIVKYLHEQYPHIRVIVPQMAMSAATMIACGAHEIVMGKHSTLGPIDPQIYIPSQQTFEPAQAVLDQYDRIIKEAKIPGREVLVTMLPLYGPSLIERCENAIELSKEMVSTWLKKWMFKGEKDGTVKATEIADYLANHNKFKTHGRHVTRDMRGIKKLKILKLEDDKKFQDLVLSVFHSATHTFNGTPAVKIIENHLGKAYIKMYGGPAFAPKAKPRPEPKPKDKKD